MEGKESPYGVENTNQAFWLTPSGHITPFAESACDVRAVRQWGPVDTSFTNLCLDGSQPPLRPVGLKLLSCEEASANGVRWSKAQGPQAPSKSQQVDVHEPAETSLLREKLEPQDTCLYMVR